VRYYDQTLGDNPSTSYGPPLSLDWNYRVGESQLVDDYETKRGERRTATEMMMSSMHRRTILTEDCGTSHRELKAALRSSNGLRSPQLVQKVRGLVGRRNR